MSRRAAGSRKIIHVDLDAFFASVEQRDRPELKGRPVIVGGTPEGRGVVAAASYEARRFGVHSAMPASRARKLCPQGVFLTPDIQRYAAVSREIRAIFRSYTSLVEPLSLDEAYLDVTENTRGEPSATRLAEAIRAEIRERTNLTASAGVGPNKLVAKIASDMRKPDGLFVVPPDEVETFMRDLPVRRIPGVGSVTEKRCRELGIRTCADVQAHDEGTLVAWFGSFGSALLRMARGEDDRPVESTRERRSCGIEDTFPHDILDTRRAIRELERLAQALGVRLRRNGARGRTVTLKVKYADFRRVTRSRTLADALDDPRTILDVALDLLSETEVGVTPVRLLGISLSHLEPACGGRQLRLPFPAEEAAPGRPEDPML